MKTWLTQAWDPEGWGEILETIRRNRMRTFLTAFSVAWGILILIVLLGSGQGLSHGVEYGFRDDATNAIWMFSGQTSVPYHGLRPGRWVQFTNQDHDDIQDNVKKIDHLTSRFWMRGSGTVRYHDQSAAYNVRCVHPDQQYIEKTIVTQGRFLDRLDIENFRKVAVIGDRVKAQLFKDKEALGDHIEINGLSFLIVGVFVDQGSEGENETIYIPISTAQRAFGGQDHIGGMIMTAGSATVAETKALMDDLRRRAAARHNFDPTDQRAVFISDAIEEYQRFVNLIGGIRIFLWVVGIGTLLAGVVGVSNIMMIAVKERTKEIGIRKALGASPGSILGLVLREAVLVTAAAGYFGLVAGVGVLELMARGITGSDYFKDPSVDLGVAGAAIGLLVVAGALAGFFPARRAASIRPVEALRDE